MNWLGIAAIVFGAAFISAFVVGFGIEMLMRKDVIWGRPRSARDIALREIPRASIIGIVVVTLRFVWHTVHLFL